MPHEVLELNELACAVGLRIARQPAITAVLCRADFDGVVSADDLAELLGDWGAYPT